jgi:hypothetical protein
MGVSTIQWPPACTAASHTLNRRRRASTQHCRHKHGQGGAARRRTHGSLRGVTATQLARQPPTHAAVVHSSRTRPIRQRQTQTQTHIKFVPRTCEWQSAPPPERSSRSLEPMTNARTSRTMDGASSGGSTRGCTPSVRDCQAARAQATSCGPLHTHTRQQRLRRQLTMLIKTRAHVSAVVVKGTSLKLRGRCSTACVDCAAALWRCFCCSHAWSSYGQVARASARQCSSRSGCTTTSCARDRVRQCLRTASLCWFPAGPSQEAETNTGTLCQGASVSIGYQLPSPPLHDGDAPRCPCEAQTDTRRAQR